MTLPNTIGDLLWTILSSSSVIMLQCGLNVLFAKHFLRGCWVSLPSVKSAPSFILQLIFPVFRTYGQHQFLFVINPIFALGLALNKEISKFYTYAPKSKQINQIKVIYFSGDMCMGDFSKRGNFHVFELNNLN